VPELSKQPTPRAASTEPTGRGKGLTAIDFLELAAPWALKDRQQSHGLFPVLRTAAKPDCPLAPAWLIWRGAAIASLSKPRHSLDHLVGDGEHARRDFETHPRAHCNVTPVRVSSECPEMSRLTRTAHRSARPSRSRKPDRNVRRSMSKSNAACGCRIAEHR
jgi:hypothetical protein